MKNRKLILLACVMVPLMCVTGCQKNNNSNEPTSSAPVIERDPPEFLTSLPIPKDLKTANEHKGTREVFTYQTKVYDINGNGTTTVEKKADVYLPYDYDETKNYNVLYLMHGGGEDYSYWLTKEKDTMPVLDNIFANEIAEACIIVAPSFYTGTSSTGSMNSETI